jgi:integrase
MSTIRQRGDKWQAIVRIKREGAIVHQESKTFASEKLARDWANRVEAQIDLVGVVARVRQKFTFGQLIDMYRTEREKYKPMSRALHGDLDLLKQHMGALRLEALTAEAFSKFARDRRGPVTGPATVLHNLATARMVLNAAKAMFGIQVDGQPVTEAIQVLQLHGVVARSQRRERRVSDAELDALVAEFERIALHPSTRIPMDKIVRLAVVFPRRLGELVGMRWEDYKDNVMVLRDTKHPRKQRTERVPVPRAARRIIDSLPKIDELVLPYKSESCSAAFERACQRLGIQDLHFHDLRHEGVSRLFEQGLDIPRVAMISGHMTWANLKRYTHLTPQQVLEALDADTQAKQEAGPEPA